VGELCGGESRLGLERGPHVSAVGGADEEPVAVGTVAAGNLLGREHVRLMVSEDASGDTQRGGAEARLFALEAQVSPVQGLGGSEEEGALDVGLGGVRRGEDHADTDQRRGECVGWPSI
jgi:hypothetical protein